MPLLELIGASVVLGLLTIGIKSVLRWLEKKEQAK
jgi:hypothetical protein